MKILKCECERFSLWHTCNAEIKPSSIKVCVFKMRFWIWSHPQIKIIFQSSSACFWKISWTEIWSDYYLAIWD